MCSVLNFVKTKYAFRNIIAGLLYYVITTAAWILARKAVIDLLGIEYQGADGLFSNVITMLSIAELGLGSAIVYHLYYPLRVNDKEAVKSLAVFYKKCYYIIAAVIFLLGIGIIPLIPSLIKDYSLKYPVWQVYIWFLLDSVCSYLISYRRSILMADQKNYIIILTDALFTVLTKAVQIAVLRSTGSFLIYLSLMWIFRLAENVFLHIYTGKYYPYLKEKDVKPLSGDILSDIKEKVNGAVFHNMAGFIVLGTDNILITRYLGLAVSGIYSNYYLLIRALQSICTKFVAAPKAGIGHLLTLRDDEKNREVFREMQIFNFVMVCCASCGIMFIATPIVSAVFGSAFTVNRFTVIVLALNYYVQGMRGVYNVFKEAAGILYEDRYVPVFESVLNIIASIVFMRFFGLAGVFLGTIVSSMCLFLYTYPVLVVKGLLKTGYREYFLEILWRLAVLMVSFVLTAIGCNAVTADDPVSEIILKIIITGLSSVFCSVVLYGIWHKSFSCLVKRFFLVLKK